MLSTLLKLACTPPLRALLRATSSPGCQDTFASRLSFVHEAARFALPLGQPFDQHQAGALDSQCSQLARCLQCARYLQVIGSPLHIPSPWPSRSCRNPRTMSADEAAMTFEDQFAEAFAPAVTDINATYVILR